MSNILIWNKIVNNLYNVYNPINDNLEKRNKKIKKNNIQKNNNSINKIIKNDNIKNLNIILKNKKIFLKENYVYLYRL